MPRAKGGPKTRHRRKKILKKAKGYVGGRSRLYRTAAETLLRAGAFAYRDRKAKKRTARRLWITRINAACREAGITYSQLMVALRRAGILLDRKVLAEMAVRDPDGFRRLTETARTQELLADLVGPGERAELLRRARESYAALGIAASDIDSPP